MIDKSIICGILLSVRKNRWFAVSDIEKIRSDKVAVCTLPLYGSEKTIYSVLDYNIKEIKPLFPYVNILALQFNYLINVI